MTYTAVVHLAAALAGLGGATAAIIVGTLLLRLLLLPLTIQSVRAARAADGIPGLGGCLPMLVQAPVFLLLSRLCYADHIAGHPNLLLRQKLLGVPLGTRFIADASGTTVVVFGLLALLLGLVAAWSSARARRIAALADPSAVGPYGWLPRVLPYLTVASAAVVPLAAGLYLLTSTAFTAVESVLLRRGLPPRPA